MKIPITEFKQDYKKSWEYAVSQIYDYQKEVERLNKIIEIKNNRIQQLMKRTRSARINKAIEYIKNNAMYSEEWNKCCDDLYTKDCDEVLKILQGSDKE